MVSVNRQVAALIAHPRVGASTRSIGAWPEHLPAWEVDRERFVQPQFGGLGLANVGPTVLALLTGSPQVRLPPLDTRVLPPTLTGGVRCVVLLVADGLGHLQLLREVEAGNAPTLGRLLRRAQADDRDAHYGVLTSVFPTTTVAALGSLNSAVAPTAHGLLGYTLYLEEFGALAEMIRWGPIDRAGSFADRKHGGADPARFFWVPTIYERLAEAGVAGRYVINPLAYERTPLSLMWHRGADYLGYAATSSISVMVSSAVRASTGPTFVYAYWPTVDTVAHLRGPSADEHGAEVAALDLALERLLDRLPGDGETLLLFTADHGHVGTSVNEQLLLNDYPDLVELLAVPPAGERRATYLHARPGQAGRLEELARARLGDFAVVVSREAAVRQGLFGPDAPADRAARRVGDVLLFPRGNLQIAYELPEEELPAEERPGPPSPFCGLHGGLTPEESLVPLLAVRV